MGYIFFLGSGWNYVCWALLLCWCPIYLGFLAPESCLLDEKSKDLCQFCQMTCVEKVIELLESGEGMFINCTFCFSICSRNRVFLRAGAHNQIKAWMLDVSPCGCMIGYQFWHWLYSILMHHVDILSKHSSQSHSIVCMISSIMLTTSPKFMR